MELLKRKVSRPARIEDGQLPEDIGGDDDDIFNGYDMELGREVGDEYCPVKHYDNHISIIDALAFPCLCADCFIPWNIKFWLKEFFYKNFFTSS